MERPMDSPFPQNTVEYMRTEVAQFIKNNRHISMPNLFMLAMHRYSEDGTYGFIDNLITGHYSHYEHETNNNHISGYNCTNLIPTIYLVAQIMGFDPQIVQFQGFRNIYRRKDIEPKDPATHFAMTVDLGRGNRYLIDPFHNIGGPILEHGEGYMKIGRTRNYSATRREYDTCHTYTAEEFAEMMARMKDHAESLDMLIGGQKVRGNLDVRGSDASLKVFYDDEYNTVRTRLYIERPLVTDRSIEFKQKLDDEGNTIEKSIEIHFADDHNWSQLIGGRKVAEMDYRKAKRIRRDLKKICRSDKEERIGPALALKKNAAYRERLLTAVDEIAAELTQEERDAIRPAILARTLYEHTKPRAKYIYSTAMRDKPLIRIRRDHLKILREDAQTRLRVWEYKTGIKKKARPARKRLIEDLFDVHKRFNENDSKITDLSYTRKNCPRTYHRLMDIYAFSQSEQCTSVEKMEAAVAARGLDTRIGHLAMMNEYLWLITNNKGVMFIDDYMHNIREKIKARTAKRRGEHYEAKIPPLSGLDDIIVFMDKVEEVAEVRQVERTASQGQAT